MTVQKHPLHDGNICFEIRVGSYDYTSVQQLN
jgi:hypothetical protein